MTVTSLARALSLLLIPPVAPLFASATAQAAEEGAVLWTESPYYGETWKDLDTGEVMDASTSAFVVAPVPSLCDYEEPGSGLYAQFVLVDETDNEIVESCLDARCEFDIPLGDR